MAPQSQDWAVGTGCPVSWATAPLQLPLPPPGSKGRIPGLDPCCLLFTQHSFSTLFAQVSLHSSEIFPLSLLCSLVTAHSSSPGTDTGDFSPDLV